MTFAKFILVITFALLLTNVYALSIVELPVCQNEAVSNPCLCARDVVSRGYCCHGTAQETPCLRRPPCPECILRPRVTRENESYKVETEEYTLISRGKLEVENNELFYEKGGERRRLEVQPDFAIDIAIERIKPRKIEEIELDTSGEKPTYKIRAKKPFKFLWIFDSEIEINVEIDVETGEMLREERPFWNFLGMEENATLEETSMGFTDKACRLQCRLQLRECIRQNWHNIEVCVEEVRQCIRDCSQTSECGNGICDPQESFQNCLQDCERQQLCGDGVCDEHEQENPDLCPEDCGEIADVPYYFIAIHNEPRVEDLEMNYDALKQLVDRANQYNMKLTLMFTPQWADFIVNDPGRKAELEQWKSQGHEIAGQHHSVHMGGVWDGYTYVSEEEAIEIRTRMGKNESYLGDLNDYILELKKLNPNINSGCMNDEGDKNHLPDAIIYDTCSGWVNFGEPGTVRLNDGDSREKGRNEFITVGVVNGIERKWLTHTAIFTFSQEEEAEEVFNSMNSNQVYGVVTHSHPEQCLGMLEFMDFLHEKDPTGERSMTLTEVIESGVLSEEWIDIQPQDKTLYVLWTLHVEGDKQQMSIDDPRCDADLAIYQQRPFDRDMEGLENIWIEARKHKDSFGNSPKMYISPAGEFFETEVDPIYGNKAFSNFNWLDLGHEIGIQGHKIYYYSKFCWPTRDESTEGVIQKLTTLHNWAEKWEYNGGKVNHGITYTPGVKLDKLIFNDNKAETEEFLDKEASKLGYSVTFDDWDGCVEDNPNPGGRPSYLYQAEYSDRTKMYKVCFQGTVKDPCNDAPRCESPDNARQWIDTLIEKMNSDSNPVHLYYYAFATHANSGLGGVQPEWEGMKEVFEYLDEKVASEVKIKYITPKDLIAIYEANIEEPY